MLTLRNVLNYRQEIEHTAKCLGFANLRLYLDGIDRLNIVVDIDNSANLSLNDSMTRVSYLETWIQHKLKCLTQVILAETTHGIFKQQVIKEAVNLNNEAGLMKLYRKPADQVMFSDDEGLSDLTIKYVLPKIEEFIKSNQAGLANINEGIKSIRLNSFGLKSRS